MKQNTPSIFSSGKKTIYFEVNYWTKPGENIVIIGSGGPLQWDMKDAIGMTYKRHGIWQAIVQIPNDVPKLSYKYANIGYDERVLFEVGPTRDVPLNQMKESSTIYLRDSWINSKSIETKPRLNASIFTQAVFRRQKEYVEDITPFDKQKIRDDFVCVRFECHCVFVPKNATLRVVGDKESLGKWVAINTPIMKDAGYPFWKLDVHIPKTDFPLQFKFAFVDDEKNITWEDGDNRHLELRDPDVKTIILQESGFRKNFQFKGSGVSVPIFAIRTEEGFGVGEFNDLKLFSDWTRDAGIKMIQILPVNDTSVRNDWRDSYPYNALSVFALHPIYIHLENLTSDAKLLQEIQTEKKKLNQLPQIDYEAVMKSKLKYLKRIFEATKSNSLSSPQFEDWKKTNANWLIPYALYCVFKEKYGTYDWSQWGEHSKITAKQLQALSSPTSEYYDKVSFYFFVQYNLHLQLKEVSEYASQNGVGIKGDIAIGVSPKSVDTWVFPHLFRLHKSTGAPPDFFSNEGQNWGFPTYNWDEMAKDGYLWWRSRLRHLSQYFHAFRIDHILGFFRIWEIPRNCVTGLLGNFYPSIPLTRGELEHYGIWDFDRLCKPYIPTHLILLLFGEQFQDIIDQFLIPIGNHRYDFKPEYNCERKIADALPIEPTENISKQQLEKNSIIRKGLLTLVQNVVLLHDGDDPNKFYPRIELMKTSSFRELDWNVQTIIEHLYFDYFYHRQEGLWTKIGLTRLPIMINSTKMLCCGEDLGMVPACVPYVLGELEILGLRIQRMSDDPQKEFQHPSEYSFLTVCTPSVHDTSTTRGWWEEDKATSQRFYNNVLGEWGTAPSYCTEDIMRKIFNQHIYSPSMWAVFPIQDFFGLSFSYFQSIDPKTERINEPSNPEHYWRYRMHISVEQLVQDKKFSSYVRQMMIDAGRA